MFTPWIFRNEPPEGDGAEVLHPPGSTNKRRSRRLTADQVLARICLSFSAIFFMFVIVGILAACAPGRAVLGDVPEPEAVPHVVEWHDGGRGDIRAVYEYVDGKRGKIVFLNDYTCPAAPEELAAAARSTDVAVLQRAIEELITLREAC